MIEIPKLLTPKEFAEIFRCDKSTVSRWIAEEIIPREFVIRPSGNRQGSKILIDERAVKALLEPLPTENHSNLQHYQRHDDDAHERLVRRF